jgi:hypothetical protein
MITRGRRKEDEQRGKKNEREENGGIRGGKWGGGGCREWYQGEVYSIWGERKRERAVGSLL